MNPNPKMSLSARRAWIEMQVFNRIAKPFRSLSARRAWIEMLASRLVDMSAASLSARRAWIEMQISVTTVVGVLVALRKESVDRNC